MAEFKGTRENLDRFAVARNVPITVGGQEVIADRVVKTACPHNCYDTCGYLVYVKDERVIKVEGDPDHPITKGHLCVKGYSNVQKVNSPDRVKHPLIRVGERGEGKFRRATWDEALNMIAGKLKELRATYGGETLTEYCYSGNREHMAKTVSGRFLNLFGASKLVGSFCLLSGASGSYYSVGEQHTMSPEIWSETTDLILLVGRNSSATNPHIFPFLYKAMERGAKLIVVDPLVTAVASKADLHLQPRPGTDAALVLGMMNHILARGLEDKEFIANHTFGFEQLCAQLKEMPVEKAAEVTGVPADKIRLAAELYATHNSQTECGYGQQRYSNGHQTQRAYACLAALCGHIGKETGNYNFIDQMGFPALPGFLNAAKVAAPPGQPAANTRLINIATFAAAVHNAENPPIKAVISYRGGLLSQQPEVAYTKEALKKLELFVVIEQFMTDDTDWADVVLPGCHFLEQYGLHPSYWHHYLQVTVPVCQSAYEAVPDIEIWAELGRRMGWEEYFPRETTGLDYIRTLLPDGFPVDKAVSPNGPLLLPEEWCPRVPYADLKFTTKSGKFEFFSLEMAERGKKFPGDYAPVPYPLEPAEGPVSTPELAKKYPLTLISQHPAVRTHSQFYNLPWIREIEGPPRIFINVNDARARGIRDGDRVRVFNDRGAIDAVYAAPTERVKEGVAELSSGMWIKLGASVNVLASRTTGGPRDVGNGIMEEYHPLLDGNTTAYFNTLVQVEKASGGEA